jgi:hypothetical protein
VGVESGELRLTWLTDGQPQAQLTLAVGRTVDSTAFSGNGAVLRVAFDDGRSRFGTVTPVPLGRGPVR